MGTATQQPEGIGHKIREYRLHAEMRQKDLAKRVGVEPVTVSRWERGEVEPSALNRVKLARVFGVSPNEFRESVAA